MSIAIPQQLTNYLKQLGIVCKQNDTVVEFSSSKGSLPTAPKPKSRIKILHQHSSHESKARLLDYAREDLEKEKDNLRRADQLKQELCEKKERQRQEKLTRAKKLKQQEQLRNLERKKKQEEARQQKRQQQQRAIKLKQQKDSEQAERLRQKRIQEEQAQQQAQRQLQEQKRRQEAKEHERESQRKKKQSLMEGLRDSSQSVLLDILVNFTSPIVQAGEINCAINSVGDIKKVTKDLLIWTDSFIDKLDVNQPDQINTLNVKLWNVIVNELIMKAKKEGIQMIPPVRLDSEVFKNCINTYCLMINVLRVKGLEKVWLYMVGKTLGLLDFIYKRKDQISDFKHLDLYAKGYVTKFGDNCENVYYSRLDQLTYFLFGLLLMNPFDCFMEIGNRTGLQSNVRQRVNKLNKPWDYSIFWLLISEMRKIPYRHFKPVCYNNILSIMNTQMVEARSTGQKKEFLNLYKVLVDDALQFDKQQAADPEMRELSRLQVDGYFDGDSFSDLLFPVKSLGKDKKKMVENHNINDVNAKGTVFYYFKSEES